MRAQQAREKRRRRASRQTRVKTSRMARITATLSIRLLINFSIDSFIGAFCLGMRFLPMSHHFMFSTGHSRHLIAQRWNLAPRRDSTLRYPNMHRTSRFGLKGSNIPRRRYSHRIVMRGATLGGGGNCISNAVIVATRRQMIIWRTAETRSFNAKLANNRLALVPQSRGLDRRGLLTQSTAILFRHPHALMKQPLRHELNL